jgi:hypothetical protein
VRLGEQAPALGNQGHAARGDPVCGQAADRLAVEQHLPGRDGQEAADRAEERGFPGAVGPDDGHDLPRRDLEVDAEQRLEVAVERRQPRGGQQRAHASRPR